MTWSKAPGLVLLTVLVTGCGNGGDRAPSPNATALARRAVAVTEVPDLFHCLDNLGTALKKNPGRGEISLSCLTGTYHGQTTSGRDCNLEVNGETQEFRFQVERTIVTIKMEFFAHNAEGLPMLNIEDAGAPQQPGIQLKRFTGSLVPTTEYLILRIAGGRPVLPEMIYQITENGTTKSVLCRFGK